MNAMIKKKVIEILVESGKTQDIASKKNWHLLEYSKTS